MEEMEYISAVKRNGQRLYLIAYSFTKSKADSEDILQETFLKLLKSKVEFTDNDHIDKWLTRVCVNESKDCVVLPFRKDAALEDARQLYSFDNFRELDVFNAVMSLPKKERMVIHLFYYEDLPVSAISKMLNTKDSTVKTRLHRARKALKEKLGEEWIYE